MAARYYSIVADEALRKSIQAMGEKGSHWLASKVIDSGDLDSTANTRTGPNGEKRHGTDLKPITYFTIYKALAYWGQVIGKKDLRAKAEKVFKFDRDQKK